MNYGEIKQNIISLGFAEESDYEEYAELGYTFDSINRAISQIATIFPYVAKYEFELDETDEGLLYVDMEDRSGFLDFADTPVLFEKDGTETFKRFGDYKTEMGHTLVFDADKNKGSFRVYYNKRCTQVVPQITDDEENIVQYETPDTFVPELPLKVHHLIPLLASYYLWLDDDAPKATQYYNMYETELSIIQQKEGLPKMRVETDWRGM